ncbi:MAG: DUF2784 domain-containing protein [Desulfopila sp.]|jgi:hypothetical protein|nr:DUF2784 domain-containing protein [Desulfopila sp.]
MHVFLLHCADIFFPIFHTTFALFNVFGWIWPKTRKLNLFTLVLTAASWFILGMFFGIGYCPLTDWHYRILIKLGHDNLPYSYIQFVTERLTDFHPSPQPTEIVTVAVLCIAFACSLYCNYRDWKASSR